MGKNTFPWIYTGNRQQPIGFPFIFVEKKIKHLVETNIRYMAIKGTT